MSQINQKPIKNYQEISENGHKRLKIVYNLKKTVRNRLKLAQISLNTSKTI